MNIDETLRFLDESALRIAVFGEYSAGKSTFLNALIGEDILSVAVEPTTAVPTYVRYAREFNIGVYKEDGSSLKLFEKDPPFWTRFVGRESILNTLAKQRNLIRSFLKEWTKEGEHASVVSHISIELPHSILKNKIELVDTPGVNNEFTKHHQFTEKVSKETDVAILLMDARHGGGKRTEFEFMNAIHKAVGKSIVVLNKMDTLDPDEREDLLDYIKSEALPKHWSDVVIPQVFGISSLVRPGWESENNHPELANAFQTFLDTIGNICGEQRGGILLHRMGNPEKVLFNEAHKLEKQAQYDNAHRKFYDLYDILKAANLDCQPAISGIERTEAHLKKQVHSVESLNGQINQAMELEKDSPDQALKILEGVVPALRELKVPDEEAEEALHRISQRIEARDSARNRIRSSMENAASESEKGDHVGAVASLESVHSDISTAELGEEEYTRFQAVLETYKENRRRWADSIYSLVSTGWQEKLQNRQFRAVQEFTEQLGLAEKFCSDKAEPERLLNVLRDKLTAWREYTTACSNLAKKLTSNLQKTRLHSDALVELYDDIQKVRHLAENLISVRPSKLPSCHGYLDIEQKIELAEHCNSFCDDKSVLEKLLSYLHSRKDELTEKQPTLKDLWKKDVDLKPIADAPDVSLFLSRLIAFTPTPFATRKKALKYARKLKKFRALYDEDIGNRLRALENHHSVWPKVSFATIALIAIACFLIFKPPTDAELEKRVRTQINSSDFSDACSTIVGIQDDATAHKLYSLLACRFVGSSQIENAFKCVEQYQKRYKAGKSLPPSFHLTRDILECIVSAKGAAESFQYLRRVRNTQEREDLFNAIASILISGREEQPLNWQQALETYFPEKAKVWKAEKLLRLAQEHLRSNQFTYAIHTTLSWAKATNTKVDFTREPFQNIVETVYRLKSLNEYTQMSRCFEQGIVQAYFLDAIIERLSTKYSSKEDFELAADVAKSLRSIRGVRDINTYTISSLGTVATRQANAGYKSDAVKTLDSAIALARALGNDGLLQALIETKDEIQL